MAFPDAPAPEPLVRSCQATRRRLLEWGVAKLFNEGTLKRGLAAHERAELYRLFIDQFYGRRNSLGQLILDHPDTARYWVLQFVQPYGCLPPPNPSLESRFPPRQKNYGAKYRQSWQALHIRTRPQLQWRLWVNPNPAVHRQYGPPQRLETPETPKTPETSHRSKPEIR
jgi:hypothetical protein